MFSKLPEGLYFNDSYIIALEAATYSPNFQPMESCNPLVAMQMLLSFIAFKNVLLFVKKLGIIRTLEHLIEKLSF